MFSIFKTKTLIFQKPKQWFSSAPSTSSLFSQRRDLGPRPVQFRSSQVLDSLEWMVLWLRFILHQAGIPIGIPMKHNTGIRMGVLIYELVQDFASIHSTSQKNCIRQSAIQKQVQNRRDVRIVNSHRISHVVVNLITTTDTPCCFSNDQS